MCNRLTRFDVDIIPEDTRPYFRDVYDHVIRINDMIDNTRELLTTALEANLSLITISQNEDTKRLAGWAAIITTPTLIATIYGMNFTNMPELSWRYGYPAVLCLMVAASSGPVHRLQALRLAVAGRRFRPRLAAPASPERIVGAAACQESPSMSTSRLVRSLVVAAGICVSGGCRARVRARPRPGQRRRRPSRPSAPTPASS